MTLFCKCAHRLFWAACRASGSAGGRRVGRAVPSLGGVGRVRLPAGMVASRADGGRSWVCLGGSLQAFYLACRSMGRMLPGVAARTENTILNVAHFAHDTRRQGSAFGFVWGSVPRVLSWPRGEGAPWHGAQSPRPQCTSLAAAASFFDSKPAVATCSSSIP